MGIGPNLTLQATVNPDFGQVDADPAEVNLTTQETLFSEKRPFFAEDARFTDDKSRPRKFLLLPPHRCGANRSGNGAISSAIREKIHHSGGSQIDRAPCRRGRRLAFSELLTG